MQSWTKGNLVMLERLVPQDRQILPRSLSAAEGHKASSRLYPCITPPPHTLGTVSPLPRDHVIGSEAPLVSVLIKLTKQHALSLSTSKAQRGDPAQGCQRLRQLVEGKGPKRTPEVLASGRHTGQVQVPSKVAAGRPLP